MSITQTIDYDTAGNFTRDPLKISVPVGGPAALALVVSGVEDFTEDFTDDTGFPPYDAAKAEFVGGVCRQKAQTQTEAFHQAFTSDAGFTYNPLMAEFVGGKIQQIDRAGTPGGIFSAAYASTINGDWGSGVLTGTAIGGATITAGKLDCTGGTDKYARYAAAGNASSATQVGCIRMKYTPAETGSPATSRELWSIAKAAGAKNLLAATHLASGGIKLQYYSSTIGTIVNYTTPALGAVSGVEMELEFDWDFTTGASRVFKNGVQLGVTQTGTGVRDTDVDYLRIGGYYIASTSNGSFDDVLIFNTVLHTANYTPGYDAFQYGGSTATCPASSAYALPVDGLGTPTIGETDAPHYTVNGKYWTGAAWAATSNDYATSMSSSAWAAGVTADSTLAAGLGSAVTIGIVFNGSNAQAAVDDIAFNINEHNYAETGVTLPLYTYTGPGVGIFLTGGTTTENPEGGPRYTLNGKYWDVDDLVTSDGSYAQANTKAEILALIAAMAPNGVPLSVNTMSVAVIFPAGIVQNSISQMDFSISGYLYDQTNPTILVNSALSADSLESFLQTASVAGSDAIKYTLVVNGVEKWWAGSAWAASSGIYTEASLASALTPSNMAALSITTGASIKVKAFLHSNNGTTSPSLTSVAIAYDYFGPVSAAPAMCYCYLRVIDLLGVSPADTTLKVSLDNAIINGTRLELPYEVTKAGGATAYIEILLTETETVDEPVNMSLMYIDPNDSILKTVEFEPIVIPDEISLDLSTVLEVVVE